MYLGVAFGLLAFISLLRPAFLIPALPMLAIAMLSHSPDHYDYNSHYMAGLIMPIMLAFVLGLTQAEQTWVRLYGKLSGDIMHWDCKPLLQSKPHRKNSLFYGGAGFIGYWERGFWRDI